MTIETLRQDARELHVLASVLEHMMGDESLMLAFAANAGVSPELVASAHARLNKSGEIYRST